MVESGVISEYSARGGLGPGGFGLGGCRFVLRGFSRPFRPLTAAVWRQLLSAVFVSGCSGRLCRGFVSRGVCVFRLSRGFCPGFLLRLGLFRCVFGSLLFLFLCFSGSLRVVVVGSLDLDTREVMSSFYSSCVSWISI